MTLRTVVAAIAAVVAGLVAGCSHPTGPTGMPNGTSVGVVKLTITPPDAIAPGQTVSFVATASMSDGTTQDYTRKVAWSANPTSVLTITRDTGQATGQSVGDVTIEAFVPTPACCHAQITMTVLPPNTFRLTGKVLESGLPVQGATVAVLSGVGVGLSTTTDWEGSYRLYGVAGSIQIKFSKPGYADIVKPFTATQNDVLDFPEAHQTAAIPSLAGTYTLTLTADSGCPSSATRGAAALPDDFRQPRSYAVSVTQDGPALTVTLTDPAIMPKENHFTGRFAPDSFEFEIGWGYFGYGLDDGVAEQVSSTQWFVFGGQMHAQRSGNAINARLDGALEVYTPSGLNNYTLASQCVASNNQMTLTPAAQPARHR
jgi:hypothetical protein